MSKQEQNVLVVGPSWVGDMVMSQVLYIYLKQIRPGVNIDVLAPAWSSPLLKRMPQVRRAITLPLGHGELGLRRRWRLGRELRPRHYDQAILLPNSFKSALVPFFAGVRQRTGWRGEHRFGLLNDIRTLDKKTLPLMAQRFMALGHSSGDCLPATLPSPSIEANTQRAKLLLDKFEQAPARACVEVARLPKDVLVEIECIAIVP
ncbi:MAG: lipopolysaccharide heptosyltransferase II [Pseudomonadota bacterium]